MKGAPNLPGPPPARSAGGAAASPGEPLVAAAYRRWAPTYAASGDNPLADAARDMVDRLLPDPEGRSILDVGCGLGKAVASRQTSGATSIGVDLSLAMLQAPGGAANGTATVSPAGPDPGLGVADARALPFANASLDVVTMCLVLGHLPDPAPAVAEAARALRPGGVLVVADVHAEGAARGWRRTFRDPRGRLREVPWFPHAMGDLARACTAAGLAVEATIEGPLALPARAPAAARGTRATFGLRARRTG